MRGDEKGVLVADFGFKYEIRSFRGMLGFRFLSHFDRLLILLKGFN